MQTFWAEYGLFVNLIFLFAAIIVALRLIRHKYALTFSIAGGVVLSAVLYRIAPMDALRLAWTATSSETTLSVLAACYLIAFLQHMMESRGDLMRAQKALSRMFNNRRINAAFPPVLIGMLPSPAAIFIAGSMVDTACSDALSREDKTFVATFFRHIPESFLPTFSAIILACELSGIGAGAYVLGMLPMVAVLFFLGYFFYLRKVPKETGEPASQNKLLDLLEVFRSLWPILLIIALIIAVKLPVHFAVLAVLVLYFFAGKFTWKGISPYFKGAFDLRILLNTVVVMVFKEMLTHTDVVARMPELFGRLPISAFLIFGLIFVFGGIIAGSLAIVSLCLPMAFVAIPDGGLALMVFLMSCAYVAMQMSPTHVCLTLSCEYFGTGFDALIKRTLPVVCVFLVILCGYYLLLRAVL